MEWNPQIWTYYLFQSEKESLCDTMSHFESLNKSLNDMVKSDFPFSPSFLNAMEEWKYQLGPKGRGFQIISGIPVNMWSLNQSEAFFWAFGKYLGLPGAQDIAGSLLGHVIDAGETNVTERPYRKSEDIAYHCDGADIVGLLCIHPAKRGGASRIISSVTVYNSLLSQPDGQNHIRRLFDKVLLFTRKTFGLSRFLPINPLRLDSTGNLRTYWNQEYYLKSYRNPDGSLTDHGFADPTALEAIEAYDSILTKDLEQATNYRNTHPSHCDNDSHPSKCSDEAETGLGLTMTLQQGDIQLVSNHYVLHARTEFEDFSTQELEDASRAAAAAAENGRIAKTPAIGKRDLLRLWVSHSSKDMSWSLRLSKYVDLFRVLTGMAEGVIWYR
jgi:hypothetical protein